MPPAPTDTTLNADAHAKGKPFRLIDFFSTLPESVSAWSSPGFVDGYGLGNSSPSVTLLS